MSGLEAPLYQDGIDPSNGSIHREDSLPTSKPGQPSGRVLRSRDAVTKSGSNGTIQRRQTVIMPNRRTKPKCVTRPTQIWTGAARGAITIYVDVFAFFGRGQCAVLWMDHVEMLHLPDTGQVALCTDLVSS